MTDSLTALLGLLVSADVRNLARQSSAIIRQWLYLLIAFTSKLLFTLLGLWFLSLFILISTHYIVSFFRVYCLKKEPEQYLYMQFDGMMDFDWLNFFTDFWYLLHKIDMEYKVILVNIGFCYNNRSHWNGDYSIKE